MTGYGSLFERQGGEADKRLSWSRERATLASVAAHLAKMLSTLRAVCKRCPITGYPISMTCV